MTKEEIMRMALEDFSKVQRRMFLAKEEGAKRTYADLEEEYISLKALLSTLGINLTEIDRIKQ